MSAFPSYSTGTISIGANATSVVGTGSNWSGQNAIPGDLLVVGADSVIISDVTDATHLVIDPWPFAAVTAANYKLYKVSPLRFVGGQAMSAVDEMVAALNTSGFYVFVTPTQTVPDPSLGQDNQYALQATTGKLWQKISGTWNFIGIQKGFGLPAPWSSATAYLPFDVVSSAGTSYVCILANTNQAPPNATYWTVLASIGNTGPSAIKPIATWVTATAYVVGPPADYVSINGSSYECLIAHTSGTFVTDLAAGKWGLVAQQGIGYGGSSSTSLAIATGSKVFTGVATNLGYQVSNYVRASSAASGVNFMEGNVTAYSGGTLTINITKIGGTGTHADWNFQVAGAPGTGDLLSTNNLSDLTNSATSRANLGILLSNVAQARLTLTQGTADTTSDITGATSVFLEPYGGDQLSIYDGTANWVPLTVAASTYSLPATQTQTGTTHTNTTIDGLTDTSQICVGMRVTGTNVPSGAVVAAVPTVNSVTLTAATTGSATNAMTFKLIESTNWDVYAINNAGVPKLVCAAWSNDTTPPARVLQNGVLVASGATTKRLLGSMRTTAIAGQLEDSAIHCWLSNINARPRSIKIVDTTATWPGTTGGWLQANSNVANQADILSCVEAPISLSVRHMFSKGTGAGNGWCGIGVNSATISSATLSIGGSTSSGSVANMSAEYEGISGKGRNVFPWLEFGDTTGTFYGSIGLVDGRSQTGLVGWTTH